MKRKEEKERRLENFETRASRNVTERISSRSSMQQACICAIERCRCNWQPCRAVCQASTFSRVSRVPNQFPAFTRRRATVIVHTARHPRTPRNVQFRVCNYYLSPLSLSVQNLRDVFLENTRW